MAVVAAAAVAATMRWGTERWSAAVVAAVAVPAAAVLPPRLFSQILSDRMTIQVAATLEELNVPYATVQHGQPERRIGN